MNVPANLKYTKEHEWVQVLEDNKVRVGITDFAQGELGDIVYLDINSDGQTLEKDDLFGTIEAVKTVSDLYMPVSGKIVAVNEGLDEAPELVNFQPYGEGWMIEIEMTDAAQLDSLLTDVQYKELTSTAS